MLEEVFLITALALPAVSATRYAPLPDWRGDVMVIKALDQMSDPLRKGRLSGRILYFGPESNRVTEMRAIGLRAFGLINYAVAWPHFTIGLTHLLPFLDNAFNVFIFMNHYSNFDEIDRVLRVKGFLVFDPKENPYLAKITEQAGWLRRFDIHNYWVMQKTIGWENLKRQRQSVLDTIAIALERFNLMTPPYAIHRAMLTQT